MSSNQSQVPSSAAPAAQAAAPPTYASPSRLRRLGRWALWCAAAGVAIVAAYFGTHWWTYRVSHSITDDAFVEAHIVNVAPEMVSGRIVRFLVDENDHVEQGQVLAEIEPVHYWDQVAQARGKLELAEAELKRQKAGLTKLKNEVPLQIDVAEKGAEEAQAAPAAACARTSPGHSRGRETCGAGVRPACNRPRPKWPEGSEARATGSR
jgi:membrane fusion protein, multidrug efflux system